MQAILATVIKQRSCTWLTSWMRVHADNISHGNQAKELHMAHILDESSCRQYQPWKSSKGAAHDSPSEWEFMQAISAMEIKQRSCTWLTFWIRVHPDNVSNENQAEELTTWIRVHAGNVSNGNQAEKLHMTHILDESSCSQCQQWKSNRGAAYDSQAGWDFMQAMSAMEIKQRSCQWLTFWMRVHAGNVSNGNQAKELPMTYTLDESSCRQCQQ